jgi:(1->4)-alpha-D-glucan 1-alpha-D-glucosylmutase
MAEHPRVPASTYRLQVSAEFTLDHAAGIVGYLRDLGVDAVYVSPLLRSAAGSQHGYDVVDPTTIDPDRGGEAGWQRLRDAAREAGLALVLDIVPNHLGVADASENAAWWDVLRLGEESTFAHWFDIDWSAGSVLLPVLGDDADLSTDITIEGDELHYFEHRFPVAPGTAAPGDSAELVHSRQHYTLMNFRLADTRQNYRRFFAVTTLAGIRVETPDVFDATHARIRRWVEDDAVDGLRVDHPDGLVDPDRYLDQLRELAPQAWLLVEKILEPGEELPPWPVDGTTGYDAMTEVGALFVDPAADTALTELYQRLTGDERDFDGHVAAGKRMIATTILQAEVSRIARLFDETALAGATTVELHTAIAELAVAFPLYRSYLPRGVEDLDAAVSSVHRRRPDLDTVVAAIRPRLVDPVDEAARRFQQLSGAVMAKGVEDTAYYRYARFVAANEVGGDPAHLGLTVADFHARQEIRQQAQPRSMTSLSTHDTKRGEDVRAAMAVLAEVPQRWAELVSTLMTAAPIPNRAFAYLLWQVVAAVGPIERERMHAYAEKAMREAADGTGWIDPVADFEDAVHAAVDAAYDDPTLSAAIAEYRDVAQPFAWSNALGQKLVQLTMPGIPDVYQGTELWEDSLVDPDNRRPVDFDARRAALAALPGVPEHATDGASSDLPPIGDDGAVKLLVVSRTLALRRDLPAAFTSYHAVEVIGPEAAHVLAFDRGGAITVATRLPVGLAGRGGWTSTALALDGTFLDRLTGRTFVAAAGVGLRVADLLSQYPVALLEKLAVDDAGRTEHSDTTSIEGTSS